MKLKELKHNHSLTDLLKVLIFSILMITPLLSVATRCLYVICNKNAKDSYTATTYKVAQPIYYESNEVNNSTDIIDDNIYLFNGNTYQINGLQNNEMFFEIYNLEITKGELNLNQDYTLLRMYYHATQKQVFILATDQNNQTAYINVNNSIFTFGLKNKLQGYYTLLNIENNFFTDFSYSNEKVVKEYIEVEQNGTLDNVFEYSVNKLAESPILSWTQQTAIYTGVNTMTTQLGVSTPTIAMLIVYWFLLTVIYIIIDIIIKLFTWLTHMIGSKSV